jgi:hypothetical protein
LPRAGGGGVVRRSFRPEALRDLLPTA